MSAGDNYLKWKQRAEQAEAEIERLHQLGEMHHGNALEWQRRAEQAENELRALKLSHERLRKECMDAEARAERAEADNAAKDRAFSEYVAAWGVDHEDVPGTDIPCPEDDACECPHIVALNAAFGPKHPGAALLERLHVAIAYAATGLREHHGHRCGMAGGPHPDNPRECNDAHCRQWAHDLDALKERKP
jgi:hypothetical protein